MGTLKDLLDGGITPYFLPGITSKLEFKHTRLQIEEPDGKILPIFPTEYASIEAKPSGLFKLTLLSQAMTLEDAETEMRQWLSLLDKTEPELDQFLMAVKNDPVRYDDQNFGSAPDGFSGGWRGSNSEMYTVWLDTSYRAEVPLRLYFSIRWVQARTPNDRRVSFRDGIPAPDGYEEFKTATHKDYGQDSVSEMMWAKGIPFRPGLGLGGTQSSVIEKPDLTVVQNRTSKTGFRAGRTKREAETEFTNFDDYCWSGFTRHLDRSL